MVPLSMTLNDPELLFKGTPLFDVEYLETVHDTDVVTMVKYVNGLISSDLE